MFTAEMNKTCARCSKVVYPIEELKCLDKIWHKTCFKCHECGMTLNMKTYKGFNKLPYCEAHIPKAKATAIADTPELKRIAENTKIQSNVKYHAEFEKQKGKVTQVADDPETLRIKQNTKIISNVAYHGDLEKKAAMEKQRGASEVVEARDNESEYFSEALAAEQFSQYQPTQQPTSATSHTHQQYHQTNMHHHHHQQQHSPQSSTTSLSSLQHHQHPQPAAQVIPQNNSQSYSGVIQHQQNNQQSYHQQSQPQQQQQQQQMQSHQKLQQSSQIRQNQPTSQPNYASQQQQQQQQPQQPVYQQQMAQQQNSYLQMRTSILQNAHHPSGGLVAGGDQSKYYDQYENYARPTSNTPISQNTYNNNNNNSSVYNNAQHNFAYQAGNNAHYATNGGGSNGSTMNSIAVMGGNGGIGKIADYDPLTDGPRNIPNTARQSATLIYSSDRGTVNNSNNTTRRVGSIADIDPANGVYGSVAEANSQNQYYHQQNQIRQGSQHQHHQAQQQQPQSNQQLKSNVRVYRALYDYEAQDTDEVSFTEGDLIFEIESIDSGWMTGKVERTGKTGMLPANYVQPAMI